MKYVSARPSNLRSSLLMGALSLPILIELLHLGSDIPQGLPSALGLALLFVHLVPLPFLAWLFAYRGERGFHSQRQLHRARYGANRMRFALGSIVQSSVLLSAVGYLLAGLSIGYNFKQNEGIIYRELALIAPVVICWSVFLVLFFQTLRSWLHKVGLWLALLFYPFALALALPLGPGGKFMGTWLTHSSQLLASPLFHVAHLLGAFVHHHPFPAWMSLLVLGGYSLGLTGLLLARVPR